MKRFDRDGGKPPKVGVIVPVIETENRTYWREFVKSVEAQTFGAENLLIVYVIRHHKECPTPINPKASTVRVLEMVLPKDHPPTPMEQMGLGAQYIYNEWPDIKYMVHTPANDVLEPTFIQDLKFAITADPRVHISVPDFWYCTKDMVKVRHHKWNDHLNLPDMMTGNFIPDMSMVTREAYGKVPYDPAHKRASFWIWWIRLFMEYGPFAFSFVRKPLFGWRQHPGQTSGHDDYVLEGTKCFTEWAHSQGLLPDNIVIRPTEKPDIVRLENEKNSDHNAAD